MTTFQVSAVWCERLEYGMMKFIHDKELPTFNSGSLCFGTSNVGFCPEHRPIDHWRWQPPYLFGCSHPDTSSGQ